MTPKGITLDGYVRVSRTRREGDGISPKVQRDQIAAWAKLRGVRIAAWHEDLDQSGGKLARPGLDAMLARIEAGETAGVAVAKLDRLSRLGVADALKLVQRITSAGGTLATADGDVDLLTASGEFQLTVMLALARMERRRLSDSWDTARSEVIANGVHFRPPFGYMKPGKRQRIVPDPDTAPLVRRAFEMRAAGESWPRIAAFLNERHPPARAKRWTPSTVEHVIRNRAYLGTAYHGDHELADAHKPIVSAALWDAANAFSGRTGTRGKSEGSLLSGIVRCAGCRYAMRAHMTTGGGRKEPLLSYRCNGKHGGGECPEPASIKRTAVEAYVEQEFLRRYESVAVEGVGDTADLAAAELDVEHAEAELVAYRDDTSISEALDALGPNAYRDGLVTRSERVMQARDHRAGIKAQAIGFDLPDEPLYRGLAMPERRQLLRAGVGAVFVQRSTVRGGRGGVPDLTGRVTILWAGEAPDDLPGRTGRTAPIASYRR